MTALVAASLTATLNALRARLEEVEGERVELVDLIARLERLAGPAVEPPAVRRGRPPKAKAPATPKPARAAAVRAAGERRQNASVRTSKYDERVIAFLKQGDNLKGATLMEVSRGVVGKTKAPKWAGAISYGLKSLARRGIVHKTQGRFWHLSAQNRDPEA